MKYQNRRKRQKPIPIAYKYMTAHFPGMVTIPIAYKYMTAHFPGLVTIT